MAGIGFRLERLSREGNLGTGLAVLFSGAMLATGHWIMTIAGIGITLLFARSMVPTSEVETFLLIVIYSFAIASIATGVFLMPSIRRFSDAIFSHEPRVAPAHLFSIMTLTAASAVTFALLAFGVIFALPLKLVLAGAAFTGLMALLWSAAAFCSAIMAIGAVLASYGLGTFVGLFAAIQVARVFGSATSMLWAYGGGLALTLGLLVAVVFATFPFSFSSPFQELAAQIRSLRRRAVLSVGALASALAVWSSTFVIWSSPYGVTGAAGLRHAPLFDAGLFFGLLALIPGLTLLIVYFETALFRGLRSHVELIDRHASLAELDRSEERFSGHCAGSIARLLIIQFLLVLVLIALLPLATGANLLQFRQVPIAQIVAFGTVMHLALLACSLILVYLDAGRQFALVQVVFFAATVVATFALLPFGERMFGFGYLLGASIGAVFAAVMTTRLLKRLNAFLFTEAARKSGEVTERLEAARSG